MSSPAIYTIGHGTRTLDDLVALLREAGVTRLYDVRQFPGSRRHPHFSRASLETSLPLYKINYAWWGETLGGRRSRTKGATRHPAWRVPAFQGYADYMDTRTFRDALARLETDAREGGPLAIMCAETLWWRCHRRLIADALEVDGYPVMHLLAPHKCERHRLHPSLRVDAEGRPVYDRIDGIDPLFEM